MCASYTLPKDTARWSDTLKLCCGATAGRCKCFQPISLDLNRHAEPLLRQCAAPYQRVSACISGINFASLLTPSFHHQIRNRRRENVNDAPSRDSGCPNIDAESLDSTIFPLALSRQRCQLPRSLMMCCEGRMTKKEPIRQKDKELCDRALLERWLFQEPSADDSVDGNALDTSLLI